MMPYSRFVFVLIFSIPTFFHFSSYAQSNSGGNEFRWDYVEQETSWPQWVETFFDFEESDEGLEEITPLLLQLERWYHLPRDLNTLTGEDLETFFWLSSGERQALLNYRKQNPFAEVESLYRENILSLESYQKIQPFITIKKSAAASSEPQTEVRYGLAIRAKDLGSITDFTKVLKHYQIKLFGEVQVPGVLGFHYLGERDPNEIRIFDLLKWSLVVSWPIYSLDGVEEDPDELYPPVSDDRLTFILGALKVNIHQSLLMATGYPLRKNERSPHSIKRNSSRIQNDKSSQEIFLEGQALDIHYGDWRLASWVGKYRYDDGIFTNASNPDQLYADGYSFYATLHRPFPEFTLTENLFGVLLERKIDYHTFSAAFLYSEFAYPLISSDSDDFYGQSHWGISWGWDLDFNRYRWYGETVLLFNEKRDGDPWGNRDYRASGSLVTGVRIFFPESDFFGSFRFIPESYQAVHNFAYTRYSGNNEWGFLGGIRLRPLPRLTLVSSWDFFQKVQDGLEDPQKFGIDFSQLLSYRHPSGYYHESQVRLRERGEWEDNYNHFWEAKHRSGWKSRSWNMYGEVKMSGNFIRELIDTSDHPFGLLLTLHGEYRYQKISTSVWEVVWAREGPRILYDVLYHNRFFNDLLSLSRDSFLVFLRQELRLHSLFQIGFSLGFYWDSSDGNLFHSSLPDRVMFSCFVSGDL